MYEQQNQEKYSSSTNNFITQKRGYMPMPRILNFNQTKENKLRKQTGKMILGRSYSYLSPLPSTALLQGGYSTTLCAKDAANYCFTTHKN